MIKISDGEPGIQFDASTGKRAWVAFSDSPIIGAAVRDAVREMREAFHEIAKKANELARCDIYVTAMQQLGFTEDQINASYELGVTPELGP